MIIVSFTIQNNNLVVMGSDFIDYWTLTDIVQDNYLKDKVFEQNGIQWSVGSCLMASMKKDPRYERMCEPIPSGHQGYHYLTGSSNGLKTVHERYGIIFI